MGPTCSSETISTINFDAAFGPNSAQIFSFSGASGITATNNLTMGTLSIPGPGSFTTLPSYPAKVGEICLVNGAPIALLKADATTASGVSLCQSFEEVQGSCAAPQPPGPPDYFDKIYGGSDDDVPEDILVTSRGDLLVIANHGNSTNDRGILSLIDANSSAILAQYEAASNFLMSDVSEDPVTGDFYLVGFTNQINGGPWLDNKTSLIKLDQNLIKKWEMRYDHIGRERFRQVYYNATATSTGAGIFVVGARNPSLPASGVDELILYLFDNGGNELWSKVINENDLEAYRGIVNPGFGSHIVLGNDAQGRGIIYEIQSGGIPGVRKRFNDAIDWYHGAELPSSAYLWVGQHFGSREAILMKTDQALNVLAVYRIPELEKLEQVFESNGKFYTVGQLKNDPNKRNVIVRIIETPTGLDYDLARRIDDGNTLRAMGKLHVLDGQPNYIGFAEALTIPTGYGGQDMHLAIYDPAISGSCVANEMLTLNSIVVTTTTINSLPQNLMPPSDAQSIVFSPINYQCQSGCQVLPPTCSVDFTWTDLGCGEVSFISNAQGTAPITYAWDFINSGSPQSNAQNPTYNYGLNGISTIVCLDIIDAAGCADQVCKPITVQADNVPPVITCHPDTIIKGSLCNGMVEFVHDFGSVTDNCDSIVSFTSTQSLNNFYPCGVTTVVVTAVDGAGNTSTCSYTITVECDCLEEESKFVECTNTPDRYFFEIELKDLSGASSCSVTNVNFSPATVIASSVQTFFDPATGFYSIGGFLNPSSGNPFPPTVIVDIDVQCVCPNGTIITCTKRVVLQTPCCKEAFFPDTALCRTGSELLVDVEFFGTVTDITLVNYWITPGPCTSGVLPQGQPYQQSRPYKPLKLIPSLLPSDQYCIYAEVYLGPNERPCTLLKTNIATVDLCNPVNVSLSGSQDFCLQQGDQVQPNPLTLTLPTNGACYDASSIRWYRNGVLIPGANSTTYQPSTIINNMVSTDCRYTETYRAEIDSPCGPASASVVIGIDNADADVGDLYLDPLEPLPFCPGEDASIRFDENCATSMLPPERWRWSQRTSSTSYAKIVGSGNTNPLWNTNRLFEDTWYQVERKNGTCPMESVELMIPVREVLNIVNFNVKALDACRENGARISVNFSGCPSGVCPCPVQVEYYYNDNLIHTSINTTGADFYDFMAPASDVFCGNYYVILRQQCCNQVVQSQVEVFECPIELAAGGNCYCCNNGEALLLQGFPINVDPVTYPCSFQWYLWDGSTWNLIPGATSAAHVPAGFGRFKLVMDCAGCIREAEHTIKDCGCDMASSVNDPVAGLTFEFYPNPASDQLTVRIDAPTTTAEAIELRSLSGQLVRRWKVEGRVALRIDLPDLVAGTYLITLLTDDYQIVTKKLIVE